MGCVSAQPAPHAARQIDPETGLLGAKAPRRNVTGMARDADGASVLSSEWTGAPSAGSPIVAAAELLMQTIARATPCELALAEDELRERAFRNARSATLISGMLQLARGGQVSSAAGRTPMQQLAHRAQSLIKRWAPAPQRLRTTAAMWTHRARLLLGSL